MRATTLGHDPEARRSPCPRMDQHVIKKFHRLFKPIPRLIRPYVVAVIGVVLIRAAVAVGWLPFVPGFVLAIVGMAVLATEFPWARRLFIVGRKRLRRVWRSVSLRGRAAWRWVRWRARAWRRPRRAADISRDRRGRVTPLPAAIRPPGPQPTP
ncbi:MAG TPA: PGPGW domain-containing protein [Phycisphaerales bacterium]|nr:PGPGW domain-containing protein [Phycisphaerales bacterium]